MQYATLSCNIVFVSNKTTNKGEIKMIALSKELNEVIEKWNEIQPKEELHIELWEVLDVVKNPADEKEIQEAINFLQGAINDYLNI